MYIIRHFAYIMYIHSALSDIPFFISVECATIEKTRVYKNTADRARTDVAVSEKKLLSCISQVVYYIARDLLLKKKRKSSVESTRWKKVRQELKRHRTDERESENQKTDFIMLTLTHSHKGSGGVEKTVARNLSEIHSRDSERLFSPCFARKNEGDG